MADDGEDFGDFTSAFNDTSDATSTQSAASTANQAKSTGGVDFFASFPLTSGDQALDFASFDAFSNHATAGAMDGEGIPSFDQLDVANMNLAELKIPSPSHTGVHMAGGVAFDIPPLTDGDFSDPSSPSELTNEIKLHSDVFSTNFSKSEDDGRQNDIPPDVHLSFPTSLSQQNGQPTLDGQEDKKDDSFGDFESSFSLGADAKSNFESTSGTFPENSMSTSSSKEKDTTFEQMQNLGNKSNPVKDLSEFGDHCSSSQKMTNTDEMESSVFTNLGNSLDLSDNVLGESTAASKRETDNGEQSQATGPLAHHSGNEFASFDQLKTSESTSMAQKDHQFGDFGAFSTSSTQVNQESSQFGDFGAFSSTADSDQGDSPFGDFSSVSNEATTTTQNDEFGGFGSFQAQTTSASESLLTTAAAHQAPPVDEFGTFSDSMSKSDDFGNFATSETGNFATSKSSDFGAFTDTKGDDDFGAFADNTSKDDDFGAFAGDTNEDNAFGDFSSTTDSTFGSFATSSEALPQAQGRSSDAHVSKLNDVGNTIQGCFPEAGSHKEKQVPDATTRLVFQLLSSHSAENDTPFVFWSALQKSVDFTVPLKKWEKSYTQDRYFEALKMDPMLVSKAGVLPLFTGMGQFEAPLGGGTALDLLESFGFEGGLESITQEPASPTYGLPLRRRSSGSPGPALLDLSLPSSPKSPTKDSSFILDADLLGLDLNPQSQSKQLTSIQELVLNERLVVNRSTWMDSALLELGGAGGVANTAAAETSSQTSSQPSTPRTGKKQNSIELQLLELGLDASKTSLAKEPSRNELSLTARTTLGRLPDLSFMLQTDKLVHSTYQPGQGTG